MDKNLTRLKDLIELAADRQLTDEEKREAVILINNMQNQRHQKRIINILLHSVRAALPKDYLDKVIEKIESLWENIP